LNQPGYLLQQTNLEQRTAPIKLFNIHCRRI